MILRALIILALLLCAEGDNPPTGQPSRQPSSRPSVQPSSQPTSQPSRQPSRQPTGQPSMQPTTQPTSRPSRQPTGKPTGQPTTQPTGKPSRQPSRQPTGQPSRQPTGQPSARPSQQPTGQPTMQPSLQPTSKPSMQPTGQPTSRPSNQPSGQPSLQPFGRPTGQPSRQPTRDPTSPSGQPSRQPTGQPSRQPTMRPSRQPTSRPSGQPTSAPSAGKSLMVTQVAQQFTGMSTQTYCSSFGCGTACSSAQEAFAGAIRRTLMFVLKFNSIRQVLWVDGPKCRRRLLASGGEGAEQTNLRRLDSAPDSITVTFEVQTADPDVNPSSIAASLTAAVNSGLYTSLLRQFALSGKLTTLGSFTAGIVLSAVATKTSSPVIIPTYSPTVQTPYLWLKKWYIPWSVACAVLGTCIIATIVGLVVRRQQKLHEDMLDLENRKKAADELLARRFAPGVTAANAPHILKMRDNFKRAYGRDPSSKSPYDETKSSADLDTFMASPHDDYGPSSSSRGHSRAGSPSSPTGRSGAAGLKHAATASSSGSKGRYPTMNTTTPQKHSLSRAATSTVPTTPRVKTVLTLGGSPGHGEEEASSRVPGERPDVTNLSGDALRKLVVSERALNKDYRYTLMLPERETTARMSDLLQSPAKPTAKEASVLQRYVSDLMAENDKMLKQLEKMRLTGTYTGTTTSGTAGSRVMLTGSSGGSGYAPPGSINKDALKRSQTSPRGRERDSPSPVGGAYSPRARNAN